MNVFGQEVEANVKILEYSGSEEEFLYKEIESLESKDGRISFSILINVKQTAEIENQCIHISLVHIIDGGIQNPSDSGIKPKQAISRLSLGQIKLYDSEENRPAKTTHPKLTLIKDYWDTKRLIKWSFSGVPTRGPGSYAITLDVFPSENQRKLLDCCYIEVT